MCTIAVCGLGHMLEAQGIATVAVGLVPQHVHAMRPPRALLVPFELGRPFGAPGDPALQRTTLDAALALLDGPGPGPLSAELDVAVETSDDTDETWVCPVSFPETSDGTLAERLVQELRLLRPWFDQARLARGHSGADVSGLDPEALCVWLATFLGAEPPTASPVPERTLAETFKLAVEDLKAFYLEALTAQPGGAASRPVNDFFWDETVAAELLWQLRTELEQHPDDSVRLYAALTLVPEVQVARARDRQTTSSPTA